MPHRSGGHRTRSAPAHQAQRDFADISVRFEEACLQVGVETSLMSSNEALIVSRGIRV